MLTHSNTAIDIFFYICNCFHLMDIITIEDITGGNINDVSTKENIKKYKPVITSKYISIYEYTRLLTELSLLLFNKKSLSKYINTIEVKNIIDTNKIAYDLLKHGVFDAVIDRGYEKVNFSELIVNPLWDNMIEQFLSEQEETINNSFLSVLKLI